MKKITQLFAILFLIPFTGFCQYGVSPTTTQPLFVNAPYGVPQPVPGAVLNASYNNTNSQMFMFFDMAGLAGTGAGALNMNTVPINWGGRGQFFLNAPGGIFLNSPLSGVGTNLNLGVIYANDFGFSPTNSASGNSSALDRMILSVSNLGGGTIIYGGVGNTNGLAGNSQVIQLAGEHKFPYMPGIRIKLKGDGSTTIHSTASSTTVAVLYGQFDAEDVRLTGPGTNAAWTYPFTNCIGMFVGWNFDPVIKGCVVSGFGQGIAQGTSGALNGAMYISTRVEACDIAFAMCGQDDQTRLINSSGRTSLIGLDCCTAGAAFITNQPDYAAFTGTINSSTSSSGSSDISVDGGIWDYDLINFVIGKGQLNIKGAYTGYEGVPSAGSYFLVNTHPSAITGSFTFTGEDGQNTITLQGCNNFEANSLKTNIWLAGPNGPTLSIRGCNLGGSTGFGIVGEAKVLDMAQGSFPNLTTNYMWNGGLQNFGPNTTLHSSTSVDNPTWYRTPTGGAYSTSVPIDAFRFNIGAPNSGIPLFVLQAEASDMSVRSSVTYQFNANTNDQLLLNDVGMTAPWINSASNKAPHVFVQASGLDSTLVNKGWTNDLGSRADMILDILMIATCTNDFTLSNTVTGECHTNFLYNPLSQNRATTIVFPDISPGDYGTISNYIGGPSGNQSLIARGTWKLK